MRTNAMHAKHRYSTKKKTKPLKLSCKSLLLESIECREKLNKNFVHTMHRCAISYLFYCSAIFCSIYSPHKFLLSFFSFFFCCLRSNDATATIPLLCALALVEVHQCKLSSLQCCVAHIARTVWCAVQTML